jgi:16S rRNA (cytidine1402-2'-O)-methyltransferase
VLLYEAPHRLERTLTDLISVCGSERRVAFGRELTKLHEEFWRGTLGDALERCAEVEPRGEYVLVLDGAPPPDEIADEQLLEALAAARRRGESTRDAVAGVVERFGVAKRRVYDLATGAAIPE